MVKSFHKKHFSHSGPPPSGNRKGSIRIPSDVGFVYAFWLKGLSENNRHAIKVGYTGDLVARFKQLNKQLITTVTDLVWVEHTFFQFSNNDKIIVSELVQEYYSNRMLFDKYDLLRSFFLFSRFKIRSYKFSLFFLYSSN